MSLREVMNIGRQHGRLVEERRVEQTFGLPRIGQSSLRALNTWGVAVIQAVVPAGQAATRIAGGE